nr:hypothetical protein GCM10025732_01700 [Glycomyces mayteni]
MLADFGLSSLIPVPRPGERFSMMATPAYAPLEVFQMQHVGPSADVYSLAATLYAMLSGNPPRFPAEGGLDINEVAALFDQPIPAIPGISPLLLEMLRTALINNPDGRPTAVEFREFLASIPEASTGIIPRVTDDLPHAPSPASQGLYGAYTSPPLNAPPTEFHEPAAPGYADLGGAPDSPSTLRLAPAKRRGRAEERPGTVPVRRPAQAAAAPARLPSPPVSPPVSPAPAPSPARDFAGETGRWEAYSAGRDQELERDHDSRLPVPVPRNETGLTRRERRLNEGGGNGSEMGRLIGMGAVGLVILGLLIAGGVWLFGDGEEPADLASQSMADDYVGECTLAVEGAGCVTEPACFDAAFAATGCDGAHQWEAYATGQLPEGVSDVEAARADPAVAAACVNGQADGGPLSQLISSDAVDWTTDVYVPGDGTFLCVAQLGDGTEATGSTFARAG